MKDALARRFISGKPIAPSFGTELEAAGLGALPVTYRSDGVFEFGATLTLAQIEQIKRVIDAHGRGPQADPLPMLWDTSPLVRSAVLYLVDRVNEDPGRTVKISAAAARQGVLDKGRAGDVPLATAVAVLFESRYSIPMT